MTETGKYKWGFLEYFDSSQINISFNVELPLSFPNSFSPMAGS